MSPKIYTDVKLFGRKWKVSLLVPQSEDLTDEQLYNLTDYTAYVLADSTHEDTSLKVVFDIQKYGWVTPNYSEITVYNLSKELEGIAVKNGMRVIVEAGYVNGPYGVIYNSPIYQPLWEREDVVDFKLILRCIDCDGLANDNFAAKTVGPYQYQRDIVLDMANIARKKIKVAWSDNLENPRLPRAKTYFGHPKDYLRDVALQNGTHLSMVDDVVSIASVQRDVNPNPDDALVLSPGEGGLVGTPQQTQDGVSFTSLLNAGLKVFQKENPMLVKIYNKNIVQARRAQGDDQSALDPIGVYKILGVRHIGDTHGNSWYTNVIATNQAMDGRLASMFKLGTERSE